MMIQWLTQGGVQAKLVICAADDGAPARRADQSSPPRLLWSPQRPRKVAKHGGRELLVAVGWTVAAAGAKCYCQVLDAGHWLVLMFFFF